MTVASLAAQAAALVDTAPQNGIPTAVMEQVAAVLTEVAQQLDHLQYTTLRYADGSWLTVRVAPKDPPPGSKAMTHLWIPAFGHSADAHSLLADLKSQAPDLEATAFGVLELLFLGLGFSQVDGIIFYDQAGERQWGKTVACQPLTKQVHQAIQAVASPPPPLA